MPEVIAELAELVDDLVRRIAREFLAAVVDLPHVRLGARGADDVLRARHPARQPLKALGAHARRQHGHATTTEDARDRDAPAAVVPGRRPHRALARRVEAAGHEARRETRVGRQHLMCPDHRKRRAERDHDSRRNARQRARDLHVHRHRREAAPVEGVEPVDAIEIRRVRRIWVDPAEGRADRLRRARGIGDLGERRQAYAALPR